MDILIQGGTVIDGTGCKGFCADVGVKDGKIAADVRMDDLRRQGKSLTGLIKEVTGYKDGNFTELLER